MGRRLGMMRIFSRSGAPARGASKSLRVVGIFGGGALGEFAFDFAEPLQFCFELIEHQGDHPRGFVIGVADFGEDRVERFFFACDFALEEFFSAGELFFENAGARLPGESYPGQELRAIALGGPIFAF